MVNVRESRWVTAALLLVAGCSGGAQNTPPTTPPSTEPAASSGGTATTATPPTTPPATPAATEPAPTPDHPAVAPAAAADLPPMPADLHAPPTAWAQMSHEERGHYMRDAVMPAMRPLFRAYDSARYGEITCATCHGHDASAVHFRMPNGIMPLPAFGSEAGNHAMAEHARAYQFMGTRVVPAMSQILGVAPFDMTTHQGFGCFSCHGHQS